DAEYFPRAILFPPSSPGSQLRCDPRMTTSDLRPAETRLEGADLGVLDLPEQDIRHAERLARLDRAEKLSHGLGRPGNDGRRRLKRLMHAPRGAGNDRP